MDAIEANIGVPFSSHDRTVTRLAALTHDIGHYPYSHATEEVVESLDSNQFFAGTGAVGSSAETGHFANHEELGHYVIEHDPIVSACIREGGVDPSDVVGRLTADGTNLNLLISSDLDCDRLDYLRRTALHAGLPFGGIDADYLIDNITLDDAGIPCLKPKALGSADHFLLSRFYDFEQLPFHKAVVGFEEALKHTMLGMAEEGMIQLDRASIEGSIASGSWRRFDDQQVLAKIRDFRDLAANDTKFEQVLPYVNAVLDRKAPKLVLAFEYLEQVTAVSSAEFNERVKQVSAAMRRVFDMHGIPASSTFLWQKKFPVLKGEETGQRIRIARSNATGVMSSWSIDKERTALTAKLETFALRHIRVYACLNGATGAKQLRDKLRREIENDLTSELFADMRRAIE